MKNKFFIGLIAVATALLILSCVSTGSVQTQKPASDSAELSVQELIKLGRYEEAKSLFNLKADINSVDEDGNTALHLAAAVDEADLISFLIIKGANTEIANNAGDFPLHVAVKNNNVDSAKVLSIVGTNIFAKDANGKSALQIAIEKGDAWYDVMISPKTGELRDVNGESIVHFFVRIRDEKAIAACIKQQIPLSEKNNSGLTPLDLCFEHGENVASMRIAAALLENGANPVSGDFVYFEDAIRTHNMMLRFRDGQTPLHIATISGHTGVAAYILGAKTAIKTSDILQAQDINGATPLHEAVRYGQTDIAKLLLASGANVDSLDSIGKTPFLLIIPHESQREIYSTLLQYNAKVTEKDMYGDTVLHVAVMNHSSTDVLKLLIDHGAPINERNKQGITPLALSIERGLTDQVEFFAQNGADINAEDMEGKTPLTRALDSETIDMLKTLVSVKNINAKDSSGNTPLHIAILRNSPTEYIKYIIESGADVNARNKNGDSVLYLSVIKNKKEAGELLLSNGADIFATNMQNISPLRVALTDSNILAWIINSQTLNTTDGNGNTPLHYACEWGLDNAVSALLEKGAKVNAVNSSGESALFSAVKGNSPSIINILSENGIAADSKSSLSRDNLGNTTLHCAVRWDAFNAAKKLISIGVDVDAMNTSGKTALSDACRSGKKEMAVLLLSSGANINASDAAGRTVLVESIQATKADMVEFLLENGANPLLQDVSGRNAYHEAALTKNISVINLVRKYGGNPLARDAFGESPFSIVLNSDDQIIKAVLGTNTSIVDSDGNNPIHIAVERKVPTKKLSSLIKMGYPVNLRNGKGVTPLNEAVSIGEKNIVLVLLENGADPFVATSSGDCALSNAFKKGNIEILDGIVKYNATNTDLQGDTILHYAARLANDVTVNHLLALGLDKSAKNYSGETPSQMAARWKNSDVSDLLK